MNQKTKVIFFVITFLTVCFFKSKAQVLVPDLPTCLINSNFSKLPTHPRLFADNLKIDLIKKQKDKVSSQLAWILKNDVEKKLKANDIVYPNGMSNFGTSREVEGRIMTLALNYRLNGDKKCLEKARKDLLQLCEINNWGKGHFLDVGEAALAAGIGFDWLYNELTTEQREKVVSAIKNNAIIPALDAKEGVDSWVNGNFNWNPVCNGGVMIAALAIAEYEPELARKVTERTIRNLPYAGATYADDGAFPEGTSYWAYGTTFYVLSIEALRSVFGTACDLEKLPGFLKTADYNNQMVGATGEDFNYSDYHNEVQNEPVMPWFARELKRSDLIKDELTDISRYIEVLQTGKNEKPGKNVVLGRFLPLEIVWWDPSLLNTKATTKAPLHWSASGHLSMGVMRSAWDNPKATFVAIKGGTPNNSHGHMDAGSFILEADGVRWALDLGTESYDKMREAKLDLWSYDQNSNRWTTFRVGPEGHNILRFNNERQLIAGNATVKAIPDVNGTIGNKANLTSLYVECATDVYRTISLLPDRSVSIHDEWMAKKEVEVVFQWLTKAKVIKTSDGLLLQQNGQSLQLKIENLKHLTVEVQDVSHATKTQDSDNPGLSRIVIKTKTTAGNKGNFSMLAIPGGLKN